MYCEHLADRAEFDKERNVMQVQAVLILCTILNAHEEHQTAGFIILMSLRDGTDMTVP